jgi:3-oxoacyl-[acyl-carrier-protein] synthase-3
LIYSRIAGTGSFLPANVVTNADLAKMVDTSDEWVAARTGIRQRHLAAEGETTGDLAFGAAKAALEAAGVTAKDIDLLIVGTTTPDLIFPSTACLLQHRLGANGCPAFDVNAACSGFIYALTVADKFIRSGSAKTALVVGAETLSRMIDWSDRSTCVLFGDGAGAVGVSVGFTHEHNHGVRVVMQGSEVFKVAVKTLDRVVEETLAANGIDRHAIDWLIPHQANLRIIQATAKRLDMPMDRVVVTVDKHGNTSSASVPLALDHGVRSGRIQRGQLLLLEAFGGGFTWGSALVRY